MEVWAYELPTNFPLFHMLSKRWQFDTALSLNRERKAAHITQRNVRTGPFGSMTQVYTQTVPIDVLTGRAMARKLEGIFAHFPAIKWGQQWVQLSIETANDLFVEAVTDRDSYFTGEPITYTFQINCPTNNCPPKESGFYEQIFSKQTELPKFEQYTGWRRTENFVRRETKQGWAAFRYSIQFNAPAEQNIQFKPARLRLSNHILQALYHRYQICLFQHQNREQLLKQAITRDHHKHSGGQDCALGTRELHNQPFSVSIQALPDAAKDIRLIGTFRLATRLSQLTYPTKRATVVDKPFYLIVDIEGDGDLQIARAQIRDQLDTLAGEMRKQGVTTYIELPDDQALLKEGKTLVQLQLIPEEITTFTIPSFKLRFFHRKSGLLTAQTLPIKIRVEPRDGQIIATKPQPSPSTTSDKAQIAAQATELRPNALIASQGLTNQYFQLYSWFNLVLLFGPFALFILFLFGHRLYLARQSDPQRLARQRAFSKCKAALRKIKPHANNQWPQSAISIAHSFFIERLTLSQKHFTPAELEDILRPFATSTGIKEHIDVVLQILQQLEASIYGGENIGEPQSLLRQLEHHLRQLERNLPKKQLTNSLAQFSWLILVPSLVMPTMAFAQTSATAPAPAHNQASTAIAASTSLTEQQRRDLFLRANQFYNAGQYQQAIAEFSSLLQKRKWANFAVYYNLGNCYYRLQQYGHALAFYKKARRIKPNDVDLLHNIQLIYRQLEKSEQLTDDLRAKFLFWYYLLNLRQLFYVVVIFTCLCLLVWVMHIRRSTRLDYGLRWPLAALFIFGVIIWFSFAIKIYQERYVTTAIVVQSRITARSGYGESYEPLFRLSEADEVIIKERIEISLPTGVQTWLRIETESPRDDQKILQKQIGWIPADTVTLIE
jgi:tetratricopeptide (TPR) repeat protein